MVSGLVTSPQDHQYRWPCSSSRSRSLASLGPRISSGLAMRIWMKSKLEPRGARALRKSIIVAFPLFLALFSGAQRHLEAQGLQFLDEDVERLGNPRLGEVLPLHDRLVHPAASVHIVRLDRQHFLEDVRRAVGLQRPHLHLAETLAAKLRLPGERLLPHHALPPHP